LVHNKEETFECPNCRKKFKTAKILKGHKKQVHEKPQFPCEECPVEKPTAAALKRHINDAHRQRDCSRCEITFKTGLEYRIHNKSCGRKNIVYHTVIQVEDQFLKEEEPEVAEEPEEAEVLEQVGEEPQETEVLKQVGEVRGETGGASGGRTKKAEKRKKLIPTKGKFKARRMYTPGTQESDSD
jgi:hypothetical protein